MMVFEYTTQEPTPYKFSRIGGALSDQNTVTLTDDAYRRFVEETKDTSHTLTLINRSMRKK